MSELTNAPLGVLSSRSYVQDGPSVLVKSIKDPGDVRRQLYTRVRIRPHSHPSPFTFGSNLHRDDSVPKSRRGDFTGVPLPVGLGRV